MCGKYLKCAAIGGRLVWNISETTRDRNLKIYRHIPLDSFYILTGSCSDRDLLIVVQLIPKMFTVLERSGY